MTGSRQGHLLTRPYPSEILIVKPLPLRSWSALTPAARTIDSRHHTTPESRNVIPRSNRRGDDVGSATRGVETRAYNRAIPPALCGIAVGRTPRSWSSAARRSIGGMTPSAQSVSCQSWMRNSSARHVSQQARIVSSGSLNTQRRPGHGLRRSRGLGGNSPSSVSQLPGVDDGEHGHQLPAASPAVSRSPVSPRKSARKRRLSLFQGPGSTRKANHFARLGWSDPEGGL